MMFIESMSFFFFFFINLPHNINIMFFLFLEIVEIMLSVNCSHPLFWCEPGLFSLTVNIEFNNKTPCFDHFVKSPFLQLFIYKSLFISLKIFFNVGGSVIPLVTEKARPCLPAHVHDMGLDQLSQS